MSGKIPVLLILILVVAGVLRFYGLTNQSLWNDELSSWERSHYSDFSSVIKNGVMTDVHPPGYHFVVYLVEKFIGDDEWDLRLPSAVSGVLSVLVIFFLASKLYSYREGLISSAITAVLWCPIYFSQEGRPYSMLLLLTMLATYFWFLILMKLNDDKEVTLYETSGYVLTATSASYLHYYGLLLIVLQGIGSFVFFLRRRKALLTLMGAYLLMLIAYIPAILLMKNFHQADIDWIKPPGNIFSAFFSFLFFVFDSSKTAVVALGMYAFLIFHIMSNSKKSGNSTNTQAGSLPVDLLLFLWLTVPLTIMYVKSIISYPVLINRGLIISLPAACILFSRALTQIFIRPRYQIIVTLLIMVYSFHRLISDGYYTVPTKEQWRQAVYYIADNDKNYHDSLIIGWAWQRDYFNYYLKKKGSVRRSDLFAGYVKDISKVEVMAENKKPEYIWYIYSNNRMPDIKFIEYMKKRFSIINEKKFIGMDVLLLKNTARGNK